MKQTARYSIPLDYENQLRSLCWVNDYLIDYAAGLKTYRFDGTKTDSKVSFGGLFDNAVSTSDGEYAVIYQTLGTKALILKQGQLLREINRSYYCAEAFEYPIEFLTFDEKVCIAHCPNDYNVIEVEEVDRGNLLTLKDRPQHDFFQSRLQISPNQKRLLSAGWIWHPIDAVEIYDFSDSISNPEVYSPFWNESSININLWEINNAVFIDDSRILLSGTGDSENQDANEESSIIVYNLENQSVLAQAEINEPTGTLMALDENFAIGFYEHPKLFDLKSGRVIHRWTDISTDKRNSSIVWHIEDFSKIAIDKKNKRFAVGTKSSIEVVVFE